MLKSSYHNYLESISLDKKALIQKLVEWSHINSGSDNLSGLKQMKSVLERDFSVLDGDITTYPLPPLKKIDKKGNMQLLEMAEALSIKKHERAPFQILLAGHMDTVYSAESSFQKTELVDDLILKGPGVADMKGGLLVLLKSLEILEASPFKGKIGWEILINPDEELGSPSSHHLFTERAPHFDLGFIFEPAFSDGSIVNKRKGSINYTIVAKGKAAHAGRDYYSGKNAITALSRLCSHLEALNDKEKQITVNVGHFEGGISHNIVPDLAIARVNIRFQQLEDDPILKSQVKNLVLESQKKENLLIELYEETSRPPKEYNKKNQKFFESFKDSASLLGVDLKWCSSGGVCDGNLLSAAGLPTIDTLGPIGGHMHTHEEFIFIDSLIERIQVTALFLLRLADNQIDLGE